MQSKAMQICLIPHPSVFLKSTHLDGHLYGLVDGIFYSKKVDPSSRLGNGIHTAPLPQQVVAQQSGGVERRCANIQLVQQAKYLCLGIATPALMESAVEITRVGG